MRRQPRSRRQRAAAASSPWEDFAHEVERSRRYEHPFALVVLPLPSVVSEASAELFPQDRGTRLRTRSVDRVWLVGRSVYLLLPETARAGALGLLARLERESNGFLSAASARVVAFPEDGLTPLALIATLREGRPLSDLGLVLPRPSRNGASAAQDAPTGVDGVVPRGGVRGALDRALLRRTRASHQRDQCPAVD